MTCLNKVTETKLLWELNLDNRCLCWPLVLLLVCWSCKPDLCYLRQKGGGGGEVILKCIKLVAKRNLMSCLSNLQSKAGWIVLVKSTCTARQGLLGLSSCNKKYTWISVNAAHGIFMGSLGLTRKGVWNILSVGSLCRLPLGLSL